MKKLLLIWLFLPVLIFAQTCDEVDNDYDGTISLKTYEMGTTFTTSTGGDLDSAAIQIRTDFYEAPETTYYFGCAVYLRSDSSFVDSTTHLGMTDYLLDTSYVWFDFVEGATLTSSTVYLLVVKCDSILAVHGADVYVDEASTGDTLTYYTKGAQMRQWPSEYDASTAELANRAMHFQVCYSTGDAPSSIYLNLGK